MRQPPNDLRISKYGSGELGEAGLDCGPCNIVTELPCPAADLLTMERSCWSTLGQLWPSLPPVTSGIKANQPLQASVGQTYCSVSNITYSYFCTLI